ncbi:MAG: glycosyltransferase N-terminal domain-containing protein [Pirellulaceae bacterium]
MAYLLNIAYLIVAVSLSPLIVWRSLRTGKYRTGWSAKLWGNVPRRTSDRPCVWLHAVSVGELNLLPKVIDRLRETRPELEIVISTTTATGMELAHRRFTDYPVFYCPLDFSWSVRRAMKRLRPSMLVLCELELWPNLIRFARRSGADVVVLNARLSESSYRGYRRASMLLRPTFRRLSMVLAQNETYAGRFSALGVESGHLAVTGSLKFDGAQTDRDAREVLALRKLSGIQKEQFVWIAGSTQSPEEQMVLNVYRRISGQFPNLRVILVPRHPERFDAVAADRGNRFCIASTQRDGEPVRTWRSDEVLLVDTIGELSNWWGLADVAFVGGSMGSRRAKHVGTRGLRCRRLLWPQHPQLPRDRQPIDRRKGGNGGRRRTGVAAICYRDVAGRDQAATAWASRSSLGRQWSRSGRADGQRHRSTIAQPSQRQAPSRGLALSAELIADRSVQQDALAQ